MESGQAKPEREVKTTDRSKAQRKLRVLFIGAFPPPGTRLAGGVATSCRALMESRLAQDFDLHLIDSTMRSVPPPPFGTRALDAARRIRRILWHLVRRKPDVLLVFASSGYSFIEKSLAIMIARLFGVPSLLFPRGGEFMDDCLRSDTYRRFAGILLRAPALVLCQGETWQSFFTTTFGMPVARCPVVRNWTATADLLRVGSERVYDERPLLSILFVGRLDDAKGLSDLLSAFREVLETGSASAQLWLVGEGSASARARAWTTDNGLTDRVRFLGWIDAEERRRVFASADIFVLPSHSEGLPNALIEAMACGLPVITTPVGSIPDIIGHARNGFLVPTQDSVALGAALVSLLRSAPERERLGRAAHATARTQFGLEDAVLRLGDALHGVAASTSG